jgi:hypothetical protein
MGDIGNMVAEVVQTTGVGSAAVAGVADELPIVAMTEDLNRNALKFGQLCSSLNIFRKGEYLVTFDDLGQEVMMTGRRFRTWINEHVVVAFSFDKREGAAKRGTLSVVDADSILEAQSFLRGVRQLRRVARVRMPVRRAVDADGISKVELLPVGYDAETETFTLRGPVVDESWDLARALDW